MAASASCCPSSVFLQVAHLPKSMQLCHHPKLRSTHCLGGKSNEILSQKCGRTGTFLVDGWTFVGGARVILNPKVTKSMPKRESCRISASWLTTTQIASSVFTLGTVAVLPFYTLMVVAPKSQLTKRSMDSTMPYIVLGLLYAYLLYLSWTPDTLRMMFASKYWLPELPGIAKMFSSEMTLASAWIHLLVIDLFAARQIFQDGLANDIETRHSVSLCLLFCPIGILTHALTKAISKQSGNIERSTH